MGSDALFALFDGSCTISKMPSHPTIVMVLCKHAPLVSPVAYGMRVNSLDFIASVYHIADFRGEPSGMPDPPIID